MPASQGESPDQGAHAARGAPEVSKDPDTRVRSRNRGTPEGEGSSVNLMDGLAEPRATDVSGPHARRHSHRSGSVPQGASKSNGALMARWLGPLIREWPQAGQAAAAD